MIRERKPRIDIMGMFNGHGTVTRTGSPNKWFLLCEKCGEEHEQTSREIKKGCAPRKCVAFKPHNWSGIDREDFVLRRLYNITIDDFNGMIKFQNNKCGICFKEFSANRSSINIDHDHETGEVRGLLCSGCNTGLGQLGDNIEGIKKALYYLENSPFNEFKYSRAR